MLSLSADDIEEAFIRPIRFAMLLDDQFPTYVEGLGEDRNPSYDYDRASGLFGLCREQGWLCDVDNRAQVAVRFEDDKHLHQSDLLILDFHLDRFKENDPSEALKIIQKLARSHHFNMVIIYTSEKPISVIRDVAFSLGAGKSAALVGQALHKIVNEADQDVLDAVSASLTSKVIAKFLYGHSLGAEAAVLKTKLLDGKVPARHHVDLLGELCAELLSNRLAPDVVADRPINSKVQGNFHDSADVKWLICDNVFVAVANKQETNPKEILDVLRAALQAWNPTVLQVIMVHARSVLEKAGNISDEVVLSDPARQAGWLLPILFAPNESDKKREIKELYRRLFGRLVDAIAPSMTGLGERMVDSRGFPAVKAAKLLAQSAALSDKDVFHALNEHLCSEEHPDGAMTTGVIFQDNVTKDFWLCTTPACDLVPGRGTGKALDPWLPISAVRLAPIKKEALVLENLQAAEIGNHVFVRVDGKPIVLEVLEPKSRQMAIDTLLLENEGIISNGQLCGCRVSIADGHPVWRKYSFRIIGRLRTAYADRLLAASGSQRARIGVDFVNMPIPVALPNFRQRFYKSKSNSATEFSTASAKGWINAWASTMGTALPICTPPAMSPPKNTNSSGNV